MRIVTSFFLCLAVLFTSGCTVWQKETTNRGGYLDYVLDQHWFKANSKRMRALRAFAIEVSLARIASVSAKNQADRNVLATRIGTLTTQFLPVYTCALRSTPIDVPGAETGPCFYYDSAMVEYSTGLFDLAMAALPIEDAKNLVNVVSGSALSAINFVDLLNALVIIGRDALTYGRVVGALYRDTIELEVQLWLATPAVDDRPPPYRVTEADVAPLRAIYAQGNDDMPSWITAISALRNQGLEPYPDPRFFGELNGLLNYMCDLITSDQKVGTACKTPLPAPVVAASLTLASAPPRIVTVTRPAAPVVKVVVSNPPAPPAPVVSTLGTDPERGFLNRYLQVGTNSYDQRANALQQILTVPAIHDALAKAEGSDPTPALLVVVNNLPYAPVRKLMVPQACQEGLFQQVPSDAALAADACKP